MDGEEQVLVGGSSDHVCCSEELPVEHGGIAEKVCAGKLESDDAEDDIFCERLRAAKLCDLARNIEVSNKVQGYRGIFQEQGLQVVQTNQVPDTGGAYGLELRLE